jgi:hypothetical protein
MEQCFAWIGQRSTMLGKSLPLLYSRAYQVGVFSKDYELIQ